jgi:hypothetical protein
MNKMILRGAMAILMTMSAACIGPVDESSEMVEDAESAVVVNPVDTLATEGLAFIARGLGQPNDNICYQDAAGAQKCVATEVPSPVRYVGGDTIYAAAPPVECQVGVSGGLSSCQDFAAAPGDDPGALEVCNGEGTLCICLGRASCHIMMDNHCKNYDVVCTPNTEACYCGKGL